MLGLLTRSLMFVCFSVGWVQGSTDFGVGFNLALDYGLASVYLENGTTVDIAKVEGGQVYKAAMRLNDNNIGMINGRTTYSRSEQINFKQSFLDNYIYSPNRLGGDGNGNNARSRALSLMLKALKTATESYLDSKISNAEVVVPFPASESYLHDLRQAVASVSLHMPMSAQPPTGIIAARAHGMYGKCFDDLDLQGHDKSMKNDPEQLILTIDYSRAALTALLVDEECGVFENRRVIHDTRLGLNGLHQLGSITATDLLETALRNITQLPLDDGNGAGLKYISNLVIIGESAGDPRLHDTLRRVLSEQLEPVTTVKSGFSPPIDPVFAASRGVAWDCWDRMNFQVNE